MAISTVTSNSTASVQAVRERQAQRAPIDSDGDLDGDKGEVKAAPAQGTGQKLDITA